MIIPLTRLLDLHGHTRIAATPPFPGLRRFKEGRNFKQWTGDDSKALMKVSTYLGLFNIGVLISYTGLPSSHSWTCTRTDGSCIIPFFGVLLSRTS